MESETERSSQETSQSFVLSSPNDNHVTSLECERLWHRLQNVQADFQNLPTKTVSETNAGSLQSQRPLHEVLQEYEKRLRAELEVLQNRDQGSFVTQNKEIQYILLQQDQIRRKQHLKETLSYVKAKRSSLGDSINEEQELNKTLKKVQDALKTKEAVISQPESGSGDDDSQAGAAVLDLKVKVNKFKENYKYFQSSLKELLSNFPSPSTTEQQPKKSSKSALDNTREFDEDSFISISSIIGQLMEQTLNHPEQPYVEISDRMWPQHIEFLLRSQIIVKHPDSSSRMKLIPFHL